MCIIPTGKLYWLVHYGIMVQYGIRVLVKAMRSYMEGKGNRNVCVRVYVNS